jgi:hypothetical protein
MAAVRAPTMATMIQKILPEEGIPRAASNAPISAKGRAKTVWGNLIMLRRLRRVCIINYFVRMNRIYRKKKLITNNILKTFIYHLNDRRMHQGHP